MKILVDMNLSPEWCAAFAAEGWSAVHWSSLGDARAPDRVILEWARANGHVLFTHDLYFSAILAATQGSAPSVIQVRTQDVMPDAMGALVIAAIRKYQAHLEAAAIVSLDQARARVRILPLGPQGAPHDN